MTRHLAFLRAINLGAKRKFGKDAIKACVEQVGGTDVETYINTGNVRFDHEDADPHVVRRLLEEVFEADRGFEVPTIVLSPAEVSQTAADARELLAANPWAKRHYVYLLADSYDPDQALQLEGLSIPAVESVTVRARGAHLLLGEVDSYHKSPFNNAKVEKFLGPSTNRNFNVITTLAERWG